MAVKCPKCKAENPDTKQFCGDCGTRLDLPATPQVSVTKTMELPREELTRGALFAGKYAIIGEIGRGGMGVVYKAEDTKLKRKVALKFLPPELSIYPEAKERFIREAQSAAALSHPNICTIHEVEEEDGQPYIAMEFVEGESVRQKLAKGPMDSDTAADIAVQVAAGLEAAHQRGIIHRDIKSANIMVTEKGQAKIMDFGLAKVAGESQLTKEAVTIGTVAYMSPEQAQGEDLDRRTDLWSFGVVLYEMLTGQLPFRGDRESIILHSIVKMEPKPPRQIKPGIPAELQKIIDRALRKKRDDRYASAGEMAVDLRKYLESQRAEEAGFFNLKSLARRMKRPTYFLPAAAVLMAIGALVDLLVVHNSHVRWARQVALPQIEKFIQANDFTGAYKLTYQAKRYIPKDVSILGYQAQLTGSLTLTTDPPGAQFYLKDYVAPDSAFELIGLTPLDKARASIGYKHFKIVKDGFETVEGSGEIYPAGSPVYVHSLLQLTPPAKIKLDLKGSIPSGMVRIHPFEEMSPRFTLVGKMPALKLGDYLLDRYEVTNCAYKKFMDDGGYRRQEFWKQKFIRDGKEVAWAVAMKSFVDKTGRPGPATWEFGEYPEGQDDYPVAGVSWYEAAAYAEYAGKSLPTIYHWRWAAGDHGVPGMLDSGYIVPFSNFGMKSLAPVGRMQGMSPTGIYDIAGNVKEWCYNETSDGKMGNLGGGWDEPNYMFRQLDRYSAWFRYADFGFRCMKYLTPSPVDAEAAKRIPLEPPPPPAEAIKPCSDEMFRAYLKLYEYAKSPLKPKVEDRQDWTRFTIYEKVSFDPAYIGDRMGAFIFLPKEGKKPFQTVIHWPGSGARGAKIVLEYSPKEDWDRLTKTGRAVVMPILRGTFDRQDTPEILAKMTAQERDLMWVKDFMRTVDYIETRPEFDMKKLAYEGLSWGAYWGTVVPAIEKRIKAVVLIGCPGLDPTRAQEYDVINFAPRITVPVLMQSGRYDFLTSIEHELRPILRLFGTPDKDKDLKLYDSGHAVWLRMEQRRDEIDFLDKYFGPAK